MAKPIKDTPILKGEDLERFIWNMEHPRLITDEEKMEMRLAHDSFEHSY